MKNINILGVNVTAATRNELISKINEFLSDGRQHRIVTPNPEIILAAKRDEEYFYIVNSADLSLPDGVGLKFAAWLLGENLRRFTGADMTLDILILAERYKLKVAVFNWRHGLSDAAAIKQAVAARFPDLALIVVDIEREWVMPYYPEANIFQPDVVFTCLGAPWQDKFNYHVLAKMPYVKIAAGVGSSFDYHTGKAKRAPKAFRALGLEWLWRLLKIFTYTDRSGRLKRIINATIVFPVTFLRWRFILPFLYRPNVAIMLYKKEADGYYFLVVERQEEKGHWQLPQGGREGMDAQSAGLKELKEEIGCSRFRPIKTYGSLYNYTYHYAEGEISHRASRSKKHTGYRGVKQCLLIAEFLGKDNDIKINYWDHSAWQWVKREKLLNTVHESRREATAIYLKKFNELISIKHETEN